MAAIRRAPGTASIKRSCRLPSSSGDSKLTPVMLPPGRASEATSPSATMSSVMPTSGMVRVSDCSARTGTSEPARIASGAALTRAVFLFTGLEATENHVKVLAFYKAVEPQFIEQCEYRRRLARGGDQEPEAIGTARLLRLCHERPCSRRTAE